MNNPIINNLSNIMNDRLIQYFGMLPPGEDYSDMYTISIDPDPNNSEYVNIVIECPDLNESQFIDLRPYINRVLKPIYPHAKLESVSTGTYIIEIPKSRLSDYSQNPDVNPGLSQRSIEYLADEATVRLEDLFGEVFDVEDVYYSKWNNVIEVSVRSQDGRYESTASISIDPTIFYDYDAFRNLYLGNLVRELEENIEEL